MPSQGAHPIVPRMFTCPFLPSHCLRLFKNNNKTPRQPGRTFPPRGEGRTNRPLKAVQTRCAYQSRWRNPPGCCRHCSNIGSRSIDLNKPRCLLKITRTKRDGTVRRCPSRSVQRCRQQKQHNHHETACFIMCSPDNIGLPCMGDAQPVALLFQFVDHFNGNIDPPARFSIFFRSCSIRFRQKTVLSPETLRNVD